MIATLISEKVVEEGMVHKVYKVDPPIPYIKWTRGEPDQALLTDYVLVSAAIVKFSGPETYIFPSDAEGQVTDWGELEGSYKGGLNHTVALEGMGYTEAEQDG